ncbi:hypothetical protein IF1G_07492 [Cordyceps javanica]|uniref:Uncharacterized protein n=1 Tax=Cordyceps javanica TaxID=43265 RepID=A0A545UWB1_9HYPO|nr:hypothetical protein IF1G_07492 [Cordyceps javanica]
MRIRAYARGVASSASQRCTKKQGTEKKASNWIIDSVSGKRRNECRERASSRITNTGGQQRATHKPTKSVMCLEKACFVFFSLSALLAKKGRRGLSLHLQCPPLVLLLLSASRGPRDRHILHVAPRPRTTGPVTSRFRSREVAGRCGCWRTRRGSNEGGGGGGGGSRSGWMLLMRWQSRSSLQMPEGRRRGGVMPMGATRSSTAKDMT